MVFNKLWQKLRQKKTSESRQHADFDDRVLFLSEFVQLIYEVVRVFDVFGQIFIVKAPGFRQTDLIIPTIDDFDSDVLFGFFDNLCQVWL